MTTLWMIWTWMWSFGTYLNFILRAAIHLGQDFEENLRYVKNNLWTSNTYQITNAKTYVFSDSVRCVGKMGDDLIAPWKSKLNTFYSGNHQFKDMSRIGVSTDLVRVENILRNQSWVLSRRFKVLWKNYSVCVLGISQTRSSSCQCPTTLHGKKRNTEICEYNSTTVANCARKFPRDHCLYWDVDHGRNDAELKLTSPTDHGINLQRIWCWISLRV